MNCVLRISVLVIVGVSLANLVSGKANPDQVVSYLEKYGYLRPFDPRNGELRTNEDLILAVKRLQRMAGKPETGKVDDPEVLALIEKPRCGVPDTGPADKAKRKRRYTAQGSKWNKKHLTYKFVNYSPDLSREQIETTIRDAFNEWAKVTSLSFSRVSEHAKADIKIKFVTGSHGDGYPFDGPGGTLAHAFYPQDNSQEIYGDAHFDDHETFTLKTNSGIDLFWVAVHEFGHSLGLDHSNDFNAIMYPFYRGYTPNFKLHQDDINGMQYLYGPPSSGKSTPTPPPEPATVTPHHKTDKPGVPDKCSSAMDAFILSNDGYTYAFKGEYFWPIGKDWGAWTEALKISDYWRPLEGNIDAGFMRRSDKVTFIFKGDKFWMFKNRSPLTNGPLPITHDELRLPAELANMDAAFQWARNGKVYFFKGKDYWRYDPSRKLIDNGYPRKISEGWIGLVPDNIDAAVQWNNHKSYFFKGLTYTALDDYSLTVPKVDPPYPRRISRYWMACNDKGQYVGGKISPVENKSKMSYIPNLAILIISILLTKMI